MGEEEGEGGGDQEGDQEAEVGQHQGEVAEESLPNQPIYLPSCTYLMMTFPPCLILALQVSLNLIRKLKI